MDFRSLLFNIDITPDTPGMASLLVAEPFLQEDSFRHAVICLVDYDAPESSAMGIVLNHPTGYSLHELLDSISEKTRIPVFCGGPVSMDRLYFLHTLGDIIPGGRMIREGLWIGGDFDAMENYINSGYPVEGKIRFFIGYSGWSEGQLAGEIEKRTWAVTPIVSNEQLLTEYGDAMWHTYVRVLGEEYRGWRYHPHNPSAN